MLIDLARRPDSDWGENYLDLQKNGDNLMVSDSYHPLLGQGGLYLSGAAACLYDSDGNVAGAIETVRDITDKKLADAEREKLIAELQQALAEIKTLQGFIPICAHCKKIRDDKGYWNQVEAYIAEKTDAQFSHSICPSCLEKYYAELDEMVKEEEPGVSD